MRFVQIIISNLNYLKLIAILSVSKHKNTAGKKNFQNEFEI